MINLQEVGAFVSSADSGGITVTFGVYLPQITPEDGYAVLVRVIHKEDRFTPEIKPLDFPLNPVPGSAYNLWQAQVTIPLQVNTHFGQSGTYLYRYQLLQTDNQTQTTRIVTRWFTDPFARVTDVGELSAFVTPDFVEGFNWTDDTWKVPELQDLVVYELHVEEFNSTFDGVIERLPYLKGLGVTCLELMPVSSLKLDFDWGYGPLHYFAPNERWGGVQGLKRLVNACHKEGVAVILDVVYQHVDPLFPYHLVYANSGKPSPMIGGDGPFGPEIDYSQEFSREYVYQANLHWLQEYHVDGFRYDEVTDLYDGPIGIKYAKLAYETYNASLPLARFTPSGGTAAGEYSRLIQCAEALNRPQEILSTTYSNCTWQDNLLNKAENMATYNYVDANFALLLDTQFSGYPATKTVHDKAGNPVDMPVKPFQYFESHDHSQLIHFVDTQSSASAPFADRSRFYKLQPFAIALYTCQGIPMLWQGQEFAQNYILPDSGDARIRFRRDLNWEYFYDDYGVPLIRLYRRLGLLRRSQAALRSSESYYDNAYSKPGNGVVVYRRKDSALNQLALIFLNFSDNAQTLEMPFPQVGNYREMLDDDLRAAPMELAIGSTDQWVRLEIPSNYGYIFVKS